MATSSGGATGIAGAPNYVQELQEYYDFAELSTTLNAIGIPIGSILTGAALVGIFQLLTAKKGEERRPIRALLLVLGLLLLGQNVIEIYGHWRQCKAGVRGIPSIDTVMTWTTIAGVILTSIIGAIVQAFFATIVWRTLTSALVRTIWIASCALVGVGTLALGLAYAGELSSMLRRPLTGFEGVYTAQARAIFTSWLITAACYDVILSVLLIVKLARSIRADGFRDTNSILTSLTISTLETFSLTAVTSVATAVVLVVPNINDMEALMRASFTANLLLTLLIRFYVISCVYTLHRRVATQEQILHNRHLAMLGFDNAKQSVAWGSGTGSTSRDTNRQAVQATTEIICLSERGGQLECPMTTGDVGSARPKPGHMNASGSVSSIHMCN